MLKKEDLVEALNQIYNSEKDFIDAGNISAENDDSLFILSNNNSESFSQQLMNKYPNSWEDDVQATKYVWFVTIENGVFAKQEETSSNVLIAYFPMETNFKQAIKVSSRLGSLIMLEGFNDLTNKWEEIDKNTFNVSYDLDYIIYTHKGSTIGARKVRFTFAEK